MKKWEKIIQGLLDPMNPSAVIILGAFTTLWGFWILLPFWDVFNSAPLFSKVQEFAPEWAWGTWAVCCGLLILAALHNSHAVLMSFALGFVTWHWFIISFLLWWGDWHNTGGLTYTFIGIYSAYAYLNWRVNFVKRNVIFYSLCTKLRNLRRKILR